MSNVKSCVFPPLLFLTPATKFRHPVNVVTSTKDLNATKVSCLHNYEISTKYLVRIVFVKIIGNGSVSHILHQLFCSHEPVHLGQSINCRPLHIPYFDYYSSLPAFL